MVLGPAATGRDEATGDAVRLYKDALTAGHVAVASGQLEQALGHYRQAGTIARNRTLPLVSQGAVLLQLGRLEEARAAYGRALELDPTDAAALAGRRALEARLAGPQRGLAIARPSPGGPLFVGARTESLLLGYVAALMAGELLVTFENPMLVFAIHGGLIVAVSLHLAWLASHRDDAATTHALTGLLLAILLAPLIRIISLTLPLAQIDAPYRYLFAGVPMTLGAVVVARTAGLRRGDVGLTVRAPRWQLLAITVSVGLGFLEFLILRPAPMGPLPWTVAGIVPSLAVGVAAGFPEELIFRGVLQTAARPIMGQATVLYATAIFTVLHIGYRSATDLAFVFGVGLFYGWIFERSRSILGTSIGHGIANVVLFFVAPHLLAIGGGSPPF